MLRLRNDQWERIREHFPEEHIPESRPGREPVPARAVLEAVLWILNTGAQWHMLPQCYPNYKTVHRRFQQWCEREVLREILTQLANTLREEGAIDERESFIDATFASAKGGGDGIGNANHHEVTLVQLSFDFYMLEAKPEHLIGDRAYDSDGLDDDLKQDGVNLIAPAPVHPETQDSRRPPFAAVPTPLTRRAVLCVVAMETALTDPLGILRLQLPRFCAARINHDVA